MVRSPMVNLLVPSRGTFEIERGKMTARKRFRLAELLRHSKVVAPRKQRRELKRSMRG